MSRTIMVEVTLGDDLIRSCIDTLHDYFALEFTEDTFIEAIMALDMVHDTAQDGGDTVWREEFIDGFLKHYMGIEESWPCFGDGPEHIKEFNDRYDKALVEKKIPHDQKMIAERAGA